MLRSSLKKKSRRSLDGIRSPITPDPPRSPVKTSSPKSRIYSKTRSPGPERVGGAERLTSPSYDPTCTTPYFEQCFETCEELGRGSFAVVYRARFRDDGRFYAIKIASRKYSSVADRKRKMEEVITAKRIGSHRNCVTYYDAWEERGQLFIQMELCSGVSLKEYALMNTVDERLLWSFLSDIAKGLHHIHQQGYIHMDIKPANVFVADYYDLKIGDFGIATAQARSEGGLISVGEQDEGDPIYMAPELLDSSGFGQEVDVFSAGMTLLDLASGRELPGSGPWWHELRKGSLPRDLFGDVSPEFADVVERMLSPQPHKRPTTKELLEHPQVRASERRKLFRRICRMPVIFIYQLIAYLIRITMLLLGFFKLNRTEITTIQPKQRRSSADGGVASGWLQEPVRTRLDFDEQGDSAYSGDRHRRPHKYMSYDD
eukprot:m.191639 g.191639  ORF g.191639 m.191639 type:complete len:430 (+) comp32440_c1_seq1:86-1375(+)